MLNPFKKKDNSFKLDDISLPSLNDDMNNSFEMPSLKSPSNDFSMPELPSLDSPNPSEQDLSSNFSNSNNDIGSPIPNSNSNPMLTPSSSNQQISQPDNSVHQEITKAQLETMMSKINLMDARQQNMEQKLEMIYQIILNEVSEETRRKLNINSMMNNINQKSFR